MDDIIILSSNSLVHGKHQKIVFSRLQKSVQKNHKYKKCQFFHDRIRFLGLMVDKEGVHPNGDKVEAIQKMPSPKDKKGVQEFMRLMNFYGDFCPELAHKASCIYNLLKKDTPFVRGDEQEKAFAEVKNSLTSAPVILIPRRVKPFILSTDASSVALGAVLSQVGDGHERPVAYDRRTLTDPERRYAVVE
jgi:hypothetical protein